MGKTKAAEKTPNVSRLAAGHVEGSSPTPGEEGYTDSVAEFVQKDYHNLSRWCHSRWNGSGQDVLHEAIRLAAGEKNKDGTWERVPLQYLTFTLFARLAAEAARGIKLRQWRHTPDGVVIEPPREGMPMPVPTSTGKQMDERIIAAMRYASPEIAQAMQKVLEGYTFREAARKLGLRESELSRRLARLGGRTSRQLNLFVSGV